MLKMQDDWQEFDLGFKSQLENAEVKAPRHSWRAVSSRLDEAAALAALDVRATSTKRPLRFAAAALAFAACLGAGLLFTGTFDKKVPVPAQTIALAPASPEAIGIVPVEESPVPPSPVRLAGRRVQLPHDPQVPVCQEVPVPDTPSSAIESPSDPKSEDVLGTSEPSPDAAQQARIQDNIDFWASVGEDDTPQRRHRAALYAQGAIGGNDSDITVGNFGRMAPSSRGQKDIGITESSASVYGVPFSVGVGARFYLTERFSLGAGIDYSILTRTFSGTYSPDGIKSFDGDISGRMRYLGIPVNAFYDVFRAGKSSQNSVKFYVYGGGAAEYCISNSYTILSAPERTVVKEPANGLQWSVGGGIGVEFRLSDHLGVYLDPGFRYYFNNGQPKSVRTDKPLMVNFEAGLRFNL